MDDQTRPERDGLAWVWDGAPPGAWTVTVPLPRGASYQVDPADPWTTVGWEIPPGVDAGVVAVAFGEEWAALLASALTAGGDPTVPRPPRVADGWARLAVVRAVAGNGIVTVHPDLVALDEALAWAWAGQDEMAHARLADAPCILEELLAVAQAGLLPVACEDDVRAAWSLAERLGLDTPGTPLPGGTDLAARVDTTDVADLAASAQDDARSTWLLGRLSGAAVAAGGAGLAEELADAVPGDHPVVPAPVPVRRPTIAEVVAVHALQPVLEQAAVDGLPPDDAHPDGPRGGRPGGLDGASVDEVRAALAVYRERGVARRVAELEAWLAQREPDLTAELADLVDADLVLMVWGFELRLEGATAHRGTDLAAGPVRLPLESEALFHELLGRARVETDGWPALTLALDGQHLTVDLWLPAEPARPVAAARVVVPTSSGAVEVALTGVDELQATGAVDLAPGAVLTTGAVEVVGVRHAG
ncbi:hypothetical protein Cfla_3515 [Cellulomonas flavigena DSM 20109]|uniref:Uncharacterized protein n=1 Tax=Cellulomonas flavigena (strain ATCC 482 / DSM 20109 / BCRC 11376 / JCM 18109 / NBRC 3775 / NCIMB 8073 / NRS 134) TaxID=446466 RepID=D5UDD1_CELFN|nr:hypothetical protein [Cellulomonas flavigena]ADG76387.1 hypothetical protein Cfla_3515 [Cellulomonas flavigena DSM 20109]